MRSLIITRSPIWPIRSGHSIRRALIADALGRHGPVTVVHLARDAGTPQDGAPENVDIRTFVLPERRLVGLAAARHATERLPTELIGYGWHRLAEEVATFVGVGTHDLCWFDGPASWLAGRGLTGSAWVCDFDDLQHIKLARRSGLLDGSATRRERWKLRQRIAAWRRLQHRALEGTDIGVVCSDGDAAHFPPGRVAVVPNCFPDPGIRAEHEDALGSPTVLLLGLHTYGPNADAAVWFVENVLPHLRAAVPAVQVEIVGIVGGRVRRLAGPGLSIVGEVEDTAAAFDRASLLAVPIRYGGGSRLKILEGWARGVPVVSTTIGAEGLDAADGEHLLIADDAALFAAACATVLGHPDRSRVITNSARSHYEKRFTPQVLEDSVDRVAETALGRSRTRRDGPRPTQLG